MGKDPLRKPPIPIHPSSFILFLPVLLSTSLHGQQPITEANTWATQNFDSMGTASTASLPGGWRVGKGRDAIDWSNGFTATTDNGGSTGSGPG